MRSGRCLPYGSDITFWPVAEIVKAATGIDEADGPEEAIAKIAGFVGGEDAGYVADQVAGVLGLAEVPLVPDEIFWSIRKVLEAAARSGPLVLVLDDLHWADATLLDLVEHVVAWTRDAAILLVCLARPELVETRPGWGGGRLDATNLTLGPLSREETAELLDNLLGRAELVPGARDRIMDAAEGHPLFLEELLAMLIDDGWLQWRQDRWVPAGDLSDVPIPLTVQAILGERIDRLSAPERTSLERASIVGKEFSEEDLASLGAGGDLAPTLDSLVRRDLVVPERAVRGAGRTFRFRHILLRDAVYHAMSKEARALDHEAFGDALERRAGERLAEVEEIVAYHFETAHRYREELGMPDASEPSLAERAAVLLSAAGRRAVERDDMSAAASLLARADRLLPEDDRPRPEIARLRTIALLEIGELSEASAVAESGIEVAERLGNEIAAWRLRVERSEVWAYLDPDAHPTSEREDTARSAIEALKALGDDAGVARAHRLLGDALSLRGRTAEASDAFAKALEHAMRAGDEREASERPGLGTAMGALPVDRGLELVRTHLARARRPSPDAMSSLGTLLAMAGRFEEARRALGDGLAKARDLGSEWRADSISMYFAYSLLLEGDAPEAEAIIRPAVESLQAMGERNLLSTAVVVLAEALYRRGKLDEAMLATLMSEDAAAADDVVSQMGWRGVRAKVLVTRGSHREAEALAREATALAAEVEMPVLAGDAFLDLAIVLDAAGKTEEALEAVEAARQRYEAKGSVASLERAGAVSAVFGVPAG